MNRQNHNKLFPMLTGKAYSLIIFAAIAVLLASTLAYGANDQQVTEKSGWIFNPYKLIKPLGICAITCLLTTFSIGLIRRKLGRRYLILHKTFAFFTVLFALCHAILIITLL